MSRRKQNKYDVRTYNKRGRPKGSTKKLPPPVKATLCPICGKATGSKVLYAIGSPLRYDEADSFTYKVPMVCSSCTSTWTVTYDITYRDHSEVVDKSAPALPDRTLLKEDVVIPTKI